MQAPDIWTSVQSPGYAQRVRAAWHHGAQMLSLSQRAMALLLARARAGTLLAPTATEVAFFTGEKLAHAQTVGAHLLLGCAEQAVFNWPPLGAPAEEEARLQGVASALRAALQLDASGELQRGPRFEDCGAMTLVLVAECDKDHTAGGLLHQLRVMTGGLSPAEWTALYELALRLKPAVERHHANAKDMIDAVLFRTLQQRAAADVARHGLRRCALPSCDVTEPHPQAHKLCSGCRGVVYCCKAHQVEDRRRHKRAETCVPGRAAGGSSLSDASARVR
jgi:hypothetical protein